MQRTKRSATTKIIGGSLAAAGLLAAAVSPAAAGIKVYEEGDKYAVFGGRIQLQYHYLDPEAGDSTDDIFFRRLRPYLEGGLHRDWKGKIQWDMGKAEDDDEISLKDAYLQYGGFGFMQVKVGNAAFPFSREYLTSSKYQQLVERTFVGDHNFGVPDRNAGVHLTGGFLPDRLLTWGFSAASASIDPDADRLDFDTPVNEDSDFNEGWIVGGRLDFHPLGELKMSQGDFARQFKATVGVAVFSWTNDDDNNTRTAADGVTSTDPTRPDMDSVLGYEISGAVRGFGLSVDAEYNLFDAETVDPSITGGLYRNGETDLKTYAVEGGYMVIPERLELVAAYQVMDSDNYMDEWTRTSAGANWFFQGHDIKLQATYRMGENVEGVDGADLDELFVQMQYVF